MITEIIAREWQFFSQVKDINGRASCQDDYDTFKINREAQFQVFDQELLVSYLNDLKTYEANGLNPMTIKYERMAAYAKDNQLINRDIDREKAEMLAVICDLELAMKDDFSQRFPNLAAGLRNDFNLGGEDVSFSAYLKGELSTYSLYTLALYGRMLLSLMDQKKNIFDLIETNIVQAYGYQNLYEAETSLTQ